MTPVHVRPRITVARALARRLLEDAGDRWPHTAGVAERVKHLAVTVPADDRELLAAAAWLHDIGYSPTVVQTGFHSLDGALYLAAQGWPHRLVCLVAHHSGGMFIARQLGFAERLGAFEHERSPVADALDYADQSTGPTGEPMAIDERMAGMLVRHGPDSAHARAHLLRRPYLQAAARRVEKRLSELHRGQD